MYYCTHETLIQGISCSSFGTVGCLLRLCYGTSLKIDFLKPCLVLNKQSQGG